MAQSQSKASSSKAILALLLLAFIWGYNWVQMKIAVQYASPFTFAAIRNGLGGLVLLLVMIGLRKPLKPQAIGGSFLLGVLQSSGVYGLANWALVSGGAGKTAVLVYTMPFWVLLFAWFWLGERIHKLQWMAIALSLTGFLFILNPLHMTGTLLSTMLAVTAGISWGAGAIVAKKMQQTMTLDLLSLTTWQTLFGAMPLAIAALIVPSEPIVWSPELIGALAYNVIPATAIAQFLWLYALTNLSAGTAGLGTLLNPALGVLFAWMQLGEVPTHSEVVGMMLIFLALLMNALQALERSRLAASQR